MTEPTIRFYRTREPLGCFSNFSRHPIRIKGKIWPTTEHYFQAQKFAGTVFEEIIHDAANPMEAARLGRDQSWPLRTDWEAIKEDIMKEALLAKFSQHPDIRTVLLETSDALIVEAAPYDAYWGEGVDGQGLNSLGILLMEVREVLRNDVTT